MTDEQGPQNRALRTRVLTKIISTTVIGGITLLISNAANQSVANGLVLSILLGGITLVTQFLIDFEERLDFLEDSQRKNLRDFAANQQENIKGARTLIERGFGQVGEATRLFRLIEDSLFKIEDIAQLVRSSSQIDSERPPLVRDLALYEIANSVKFLRDLSTGNEIVYEGEDREWLLGLTRCAQQSIMATSLSTVDAGNRGFDGGLWTSDLGNRYLDLQRDAIDKRGVIVRRIFVFDKPEFAQDPDFVRILRMQREAGIEVRILDESITPDDLQSMIFDFIVFDQMITYEMTPAASFTTGTKPVITTHLAPMPARVRDRVKKFERLWQSAGGVNTLLK